MQPSKIVSWLKSAISRLPRWSSTTQPTSPKLASVPRSLSPEERSRRAVSARQLLDNPLLQEAFSAIQEDLINQLRQVKLSDVDGQQRLVMALQMFNSVQKHFWLVIQDGYDAAQQIQLRGKRLD
jgi:ABC-type thiamine transport system ATPase subunit